MFFWNKPLETGDWVTYSHSIPKATTLTDAVVGTGITRGTRGVVRDTDRYGNNLTVEFPTGTVKIPSRHVHVTKRGGGVNSYHKRLRLVNLARLGLALMFLFPLLQYIWLYTLATYTDLFSNPQLWFSGLIEALTLATIEGTFESLGEVLIGLIEQPVITLVYLAVTAGLWRVAFPTAKR